MPTIFVFGVKAVNDVNPMGGTVLSEPRHSTEFSPRPGPIGSILKAVEVLNLATPVLKDSDLVKDGASNFRIVRLVGLGTRLEKLALRLRKGCPRLDIC